MGNFDPCLLEQGVHSQRPAVVNKDEQFVVTAL